MRTVWLLLLSAAFTFAQAGEGSFVNEGDVNAPVVEVWKVFSTGEGYKKLGPQLADMDFRIGGLIRTRYSADGVLGDDGTIEQEIMAYEPLRMLAVRIHKPPKTFPFKETWKHTWTVITLTDAGGGKTHVRTTSLGYNDSAEDKAMATFFKAGNQEVIETLQKAFAK